MGISTFKLFDYKHIFVIVIQQSKAKTYPLFIKIILKYKYRSKCVFIVTLQMLYAYDIYTCRYGNGYSKAKYVICGYL